MSNLIFAWPYAALLLAMWYPMVRHDIKRRRSEGVLYCPMAGAMKQLVRDKPKRFFGRIPYAICLVWLLMVLALMRPQFVGAPIELSRNGRNIMLVLDLSESMEMTDMEHQGRILDRLSAAKDVMSSFVEKRTQDRLGLVVFGSEAFLHAPLSFDLPMIKQFLDDTQIGFAGPKTAIGDALGLAVKKLIEQSQGERVIVLLTDGQNNMGSLMPMDAAGIAKQHNIKLYIVGLGSSRMVVDGFFGPQAINPSQSLDDAEPELKEMATMTGGRFFRAKDPKALMSIYEDIDRLEPQKSEPKVFYPKKEVFFWPLSLAVLLLVLGLLWQFRKSYAVV